MNKHCPKCDSRSIGFMIVLGKADYHCYACNFDFKSPVLKKPIDAERNASSKPSLKPSLSDNKVDKLQFDFYTANNIEKLNALKMQIQEFIQHFKDRRLDLLLKFVNQEIELETKSNPTE
jgi:hypothetical protein